MERRYNLVKIVSWILMVLTTTEYTHAAVTSYQIGSGICYALVTPPTSYSMSQLQCTHLETGARLMWFWDYDQWATIQLLNNGLDATFYQWVHVSKGCIDPGEYCWEDGTKISDSTSPWGNLPGGSLYTTNTGLGCVMYSNDVTASMDDRMWFMEAHCLGVIDYLCRKPCSDVYNSITVSTTEGGVANWNISESVTFTFSSTHHNGFYAVFWYVNGVEVQQGSETTYTLAPASSREQTSVLACLVTNSGDYVKSDVYYLYRTEPPSVSVSPIKEIYRTLEAVMLYCHYPGDLVDFSFADIYHSNTDPSLGSPSWSLHQSNSLNAWATQSPTTTWYACRYTTSVGQSPLSEPVAITFSDIPTQPTITSLTRVTNADSMAYMTCHASSVLYGSYSYTWYADGVQQLDPSQVFGTTSLPGNVSYTCVITDAYGSSVASEPWVVTYLFPDFLQYITDGYCYILIGTKANFAEQENVCSVVGYHHTAWWPWDQNEYDTLTTTLESWLDKLKTYWTNINTSSNTWMNGDSINATDWNFYPHDPTACTRVKVNRGESGPRILKAVDCTEDHGVICKGPCTGGASSPVLNFDNQAVDFGENQTLHCLSSGVDVASLRVYWETNDVLDPVPFIGVDTKQTETHDTFHIDSYRCLVYHPDGKYYITHESDVHTTGRPWITVYPTDRTSFSTYTPVTLTCNTKLPGNYSFTWAQEDLLLNSFQFLLETGSTLVLDNATPYQARFYCAYDVYGMITSPFAERNVTFTAGPGMPTIIYTPLSGPLYAKEYAPTMTCQTDSPIVGNALYAWYNTDGLVYIGQQLTMTQHFPSVQTIHCAVGDDLGASTHSLPVVMDFLLPRTYSFLPASDTCMVALTGAAVSRELAPDVCAANYTGSSLAWLFSQKHFDDVTGLLPQIHGDLAAFWIRDHHDAEGYIWYAGSTPINHTNFDNKTYFPTASHKCLTLGNAMGDGQYRFQEMDDCNEDHFVLCQYACGQNEGSVATVSKQLDQSVYDTKGFINITCDPPGFTPFLIFWYQNDSLVFSVSSVVTAYPSPQNAATFNLTCVAAGSDGQRVASDSMVMTFIGTPSITSNPIPEISDYSTSTIVFLTCNVGTDEVENIYWKLNGTDYNATDNTNPIEINHVGELQYGEYLTELWQCRKEVSIGLSNWSPVYALSFHPGPGRPIVTRQWINWIPYNSTLATFVCHNTTVLAGDTAKKYVWTVDGVEEPVLDLRTISVTSEQLGNVYYACKMEDDDGMSIESEPIHLLYTVPEMCKPDPCLNQGVCYAVNYNTSACSCVSGFEGDLCELVVVIQIATTYDVTEESSALTAMNQIVAGVKADLLSNLTDEVYERVYLSAEAMSIYSDRLTGQSMDQGSAIGLETVTMDLVVEIIDAASNMECEGSTSTLCQTDNVQTVFDNVENTISQIGVCLIQSDRANTVTSTGGDVHTAMTLEVQNMTVSMAALDTTTAESGTIVTAGATITVPGRIMEMNSTNDLSIVSIQYHDDPYFHQDPISDVTVDGQVYHLKITNSDGVEVDLEPEDPIEIDFDVSGHDHHTLVNTTMDSVHSIDLEGTGNDVVIVVEMSLSPTQTLQLAAKRDSIPTETNVEMNITIDGPSGNIMDYSASNSIFIYTFARASNVLSIIIPLPKCSIIYFVSNYTDSSLNGGTTVMSSITSHLFYVNHWDPAAVIWKRVNTDAESASSSKRRRLLQTEEQPIHLTDAHHGRVKFTSTIFGSFSVSRFVIKPNLIDFDNVLSNFDTLLADTPQVLALNCCLIFVAVLLVLVIRRADKHDKLMWTYLPLVDNDTRDKAIYTLSVHTGINSPPTMTATPYFVMRGERGMTYKRVLWDGVRQNFVGGTMSNFVIHTPYWLGRLLSVKIWTDGQGTQPDWKLDRIVVQDVLAEEDYVFMCQDWLALTRGSGKLCHVIPALQSSTDDLNLDLSIVSKNMLYNDHIWLSVAKRPGYSCFTRVQRFVCAVALLYLAMLTNAMFYPLGDSDNTQDSQSTGLKIGPLEFGYREVYVGVVSAIVIVIPGFLMAWIFTHRKVKGQIYKVEGTPRSSRSPSETTMATTTTTSTTTTTTTTDSLGSTVDCDRDHHKSSADILSEADSVNYPLTFLKVMFDGYRKNSRTSISPGEDCAEDKIVFSGTEDSQNIMGNRYTDYQLDGGSFDENDTQYKNTNKNDDHKKKQPCTLPWWSVFIAYGLAGASIATAAILTVFYSLEWGSSTSNQWLMSLFFSTSASTFVIEPIKILLVAVILSCMFKQFTNRDISAVAPFDERNVPTAPLCPVPPVVDEPNVDSKELKKRKDDLKLRHRLVSVWKSIGFRVTMVLVCGIVALHLDVRMAYYQNAHIKALIDKDHIENNIKTEADVYAWLSDTLIPHTIPSTLYNGNPMTPYEATFAQDQVHYRLGPVRVIQYRVKEKVECEVRHQLHSYVKSIICLGNYEETTEEHGDFAVNWTTCSDALPCSDPYAYKTGAKWSYVQDGKVADYGPGGYELLYTGSYQDTVNSLATLESSDWMDERSRGIGVEFTVFNPNTKLFTQAKAMIELPSFGSTITTVTVKSARLYPYTTVWDYLVLFVHLLFIILQICRMAVLVSSFIKPEEDQTRWAFNNLVTFLDVTLALVAFIVYIIRLVLTSELLERSINETDKFSSFDTVFTLDQIFLCCMGFCLFIAILMCLSPLSLNYNLFIMKQTVSTSTPQLAGFGFLLVIFLVAFASYFTVARGYVTRNLCSFADSVTSLLTVVLGHGKFRGIGGETEMANSSGFDYVIFRLMYGVFCFGSAIFMINLAITILSAYITDVKNACYKNRGIHPGYDPRLNQFLWDNIEQWIRKVLFLRGGSSKAAINGDTQDHGSSPFPHPGNIRQNTDEELFRKGKFY